jgi:hypothetical protein
MAWYVVKYIDKFTFIDSVLNSSGKTSKFHIVAMFVIVNL